MSKERKITDSDLENVSGAGGEFKDANVNYPDNPPGSTTGGAKEPASGGSGVDPEDTATGGPLQTPDAG